MTPLERDAAALAEALSDMLEAYSRPSTPQQRLTARINAKAVLERFRRSQKADDR